MTNSTRVPNRLINEKSPYLLQHAYNPVDWYPWGEKAFEKAKREDKPVFLSIGYSTCHWCHIMEQESFEDEQVAAILNNGYISIKVDREERPDIDAVYMQVCQMYTGQGGWPLTIIMTPEQKPFFAGTYFPKESKYNRPGLIHLLTALLEKWRLDKELLIDSSNEITTLLQNEEKTQGTLSEDLLSQAIQQFKYTFDEQYGGFGKAPKFPTPHNLFFLLRFAYEKKDNDVLLMVEKTLESMYCGGIYDHIGFGFSRYSTDEKWLIPHFEKMLYDNALLILLYAEAFRITKNSLFETASHQTISYVMEELYHTGGGFYCAQDADSDGEEGKYYAFTPDEIIEVLGIVDGARFNEYFNISSQGNFEGKSIPNLLNSNFKKTLGNLPTILEKLKQYRKKRTKLHLDDKIITSWNSLMIVALSKAYEVFHIENYLKIAEGTITFIETTLTDEDNRIYVRFRDGHTKGKGHLDDYAFTIWAYISLYQASYNTRYLKKALALTHTMDDLFGDKDNGGFFLYGNDDEQLIARPKEVYDGAIPSGNSVAGYCFVLLSRLTGQKAINDLADRQLSFLAGKIQEHPFAHCFSLMAAQFVLYPSKEIVCVINEEKDISSVKDILHDIIPYQITILVKVGDNLDEIAPFVSEFKTINNQPTYYVCENNSCSTPKNTIPSSLLPRAIDKVQE